jgi:acetylglutamate kinase
MSDPCLSHPASPTPGAVTVVKIGGAALDDPARAGPLWQAIAHADRVRPGTLVLVHGGGGIIDRHLARLGIVSERREGIRVTPRDHADQIVGVLAGQVNKQAVAGLAGAGARAVGLCLSDGGLCRLGPARFEGFDAGCVGRVTGGDAGVVRSLLEGGFLPVLSSVGWLDDGTPMNVNADDAAAGVARVLRADRLVLMTDVPGILGADGALIERIDASGVSRLIDAGVIRGGMIPKARAAVLAAQAAGVAALITTHADSGVLARALAGEPVGTLVEPTALEHI